MARKPIIRSKIKTKTIDRGFNRIIKELRKLENKPFVKIGYPAELKKKDQPKTHTEVNSEGEDSIITSEDVTVLDVAIWNEFGTEGEDGGEIVPERSFIRAAFDENLSKYEKRSKALLVLIYSNKMTVEVALDILGLMLETDIKDMIRNGEFKSLAASTILRKGSNKPLIDTAQMLNAISHKRIMKGRSALSQLGIVARSRGV